MRCGVTKQAAAVMSSALKRNQLYQVASLIQPKRPFHIFCCSREQQGVEPNSHRLFLQKGSATLAFAEMRGG